MTSPRAVRTFVVAARAELDPVLSRLGLAFDRQEEDGRGVELVWLGERGEVVVRWDAADDDVTTWLGAPDGDLLTLDELLRARGDHAVADRLQRVAAPGCETGVRVAEHARVLDEQGAALLRA